MALGIVLRAPGVASSLGGDLESTREHLFAGVYPKTMLETEAYSPGRRLMLGGVDALLPELPASTPGAFASRNNQCLLAAFSQIEEETRRVISRLPKHRVGVVIGTSTSGISESEEALRVYERSGKLPEKFHYSQQELGSPSAFLADYLKVTGAEYSISTACTSSAKSLISGARLLNAGICDAVIAGGVDTLTRFTVAGFSSLGAVSPSHCLPFSKNRSGINIGEAAAVFLMTRGEGKVVLSGWGESSDAHHISAPDPEGKGAVLAIEEALRRAGREAAEIDYVNLHGTATKQNDAMEGRAMLKLFPSTPMSSTKGLTGHTLGAAGAIEAAISWIALTDEQRRLPPHVSDNEIDPEFASLHFVGKHECASRPTRRVLSTSYAFGGNNAALILERD
jgi:3-oxoacyl-[acyl-carrier-protein] synthase-1